MIRLPRILAMMLLALQPLSAHAATFLFIRHAESTSNAGTATSVKESLDPPLTPQGEQQAEDLAKTLADYDVNFIYTSAYQRTNLTIAPTAEHFGIKPIVDARTNEWYIGDMQTLGDMNKSEVYGIFGAWSKGDTAAKAKLPNAESLDDMVARVLPAWQEIIKAHKDDNGVVILVGHGAEIGFVMPYFARNVSLAFAAAHGMKNTGIVQVEIVNDEPYVTQWQGTPVEVPSTVAEHAD